MTPLCYRLVAALFLASASATAAQEPQAQSPTVEIALSSYRFSPSPITLQAGKPVRLLFENRAGKAHDFTAPEFFAASRIISGKVGDGEVNLPAGQMKSVELVPAAGTYPVHCSKFMHSAFGMRTQVVVR